MAEITASNVAKLREMTSAGMMDCKRALTEAGGDMEKAVDILRKSGAASAAPAARKLFLRKSRRPAPTALICSSDKKFSGAGRKRPGCLTLSTIEMTPP